MSTLSIYPSIVVGVAFFHVMTLKSTLKLLYYNNRTVVNEIKQQEQHS